MRVVNAQTQTAEDEISICMLEGQYAKQLWPDLEQYAQDALVHSFDDMTAADILHWIVSDRLQLLVVTIGNRIVGAGTLEIVERASGRICHCMTFAGEDLEQWEADWMMIWERVARAHGCNQITIKGREGWARYAKRLGFEHVYTTMVKRLE
jgi:hypothetical protein